MTSQSSSNSMSSFNLFPASEFLWNDEGIERVESFIRASRYLGSGDEQLLDRLIETGTCNFEEVLFPLAFENPGSLIDYLPIRINFAVLSLTSALKTPQKEY